MTWIHSELSAQGQAQSRTAHCSGQVHQALNGAARGIAPSRSPLIRERWMGQFYFGTRPAKVGQLSTGVDRIEMKRRAAVRKRNKAKVRKTDMSSSR